MTNNTGPNAAPIAVHANNTDEKMVSSTHSATSTAPTCTSPCERRPASRPPAIIVKMPPMTPMIVRSCPFEMCDFNPSSRSRSRM